MTETKLACPFCGATDKVAYGEALTKCFGCGGQARPEVWNRRSPPMPSREDLFICETYVRNEAAFGSPADHDNVILLKCADWLKSLRGGA